jgi:tetratricopeptide (TPR) repeat protein
LEDFVEIANGFISAGQYREAVIYANKTIEKHPDFSEGYEYRGIARYCLLEMDEAHTDLSKAIELDPTNHKAFSSRSNLYRFKEKYEEALADCENAIRLAPANLSYRNMQAELFLMMKEFEQCISSASFVLNLHPADYNALWFKACALGELKKHHDAVAVYRIILNNFTHSESLYNNIAFAQIYTNEWEEAKKYFQAAIKLNPEWAYPWDNLGYVYYLEKNYTEALKLINNSIRLDPSNSWAYKNRAIVYLATGRIEEAKADLLRANELGYSRVYDEEVNQLLEKEFTEN